MGHTIEISNESAALLAQQAADRGKTLQDWVEELAIEKAQVDHSVRQRRVRAAVQGILELQKHVRPDPEGWTIRHYIDDGRR